MESLLSNIKIYVPDSLYNKDPESSELGKQIITEGLEMIYDLGFESFTFKKLGIKIGSNESSIYRYFENKQKMLMYLSALYWGIMEYRLVLATNNIDDKKNKLLKAIDILSTTPENLKFSLQIHFQKLKQIVVAEFTKSYHFKDVDVSNKEGHFSIYKRIVLRLSEMIAQADESYSYPNSLSNTLVEGALQQAYLSEHFPSLTDCNDQVCNTNFLKDLAIRTLKLQA